MNFRVGDHVTCIDADAAFPSLKLSGRYTVTEVLNPFTVMVADDKGRANLYAVDRFEAAQPERCPYRDCNEACQLPAGHAGHHQITVEPIEPVLDIQPDFPCSHQRLEARCCDCGDSVAVVALGEEVQRILDASRAAVVALRRAAQELGGTGYFASAADDLEKAIGEESNHAAQS